MKWLIPILNFGLISSLTVQEEISLGLTPNYKNPNSAIIEYGKCIKPALRQELRDLNKEQLRRFIHAINILHQKKPGDKYSIFEKMVRLHVSFYNHAHGISAFLPWHRYYIRVYELELQKIDPTIVLPYWDWSLDARHPEESPILTNDYMGGQGDPGNGYCVVEGPFKDWYTQVDYPHCLARKYDDGDFCSPFPNPEEIVFMSNIKRFSEFSYEVEMAHGSPHTAIGDDPGDFGVSISPNDPLFYVHHTFVDLIYNLWLKKHPTFEYDGEAFERKVSKLDVLRPFGKNVESSFNSTTNFFCYEYAEYPRRIVPNEEIIPKQKNARAIKLPLNSFTNPVLGDLNSLDLNQALSLLKTKTMKSGGKGAGRSVSLGGEKLRPRKPLPERWLKQNRFNTNKVRAIESRNVQLVEVLNDLPVFVPLAD